MKKEGEGRRRRDRSDAKQAEQEARKKDWDRTGQLTLLYCSHSHLTSAHTLSPQRVGSDDRYPSC